MLALELSQEIGTLSVTLTVRILSKELLGRSLRNEKAKANTELSLSNWQKQLLPHLGAQKVGLGEARDSASGW